MKEKKTNLPQEQKKEKLAPLAKLVMLAVLAVPILFVTACPSSSSGSSSGGGGAASDNTPPAVVTLNAPTVSGLTITLTWTDPTDADFSHLLISWDPATRATSASSSTETLPPPRQVNKGVQTTSIGGLTASTPYSFTAISVDATGNRSAASTAVMMTTGATADMTPPAVIANLAAANAAQANVALTWTEPTDADYSHVNISWMPTGGSTANPLRVPKGTSTATIVGLGKRVPYSFTAVSVDTTGNPSAARAANATIPIGRVAMFSLGTAQGDFGFGACQNALAGNAAMNTASSFSAAERATQNAIGAHMTGLGYTKAVFYGSRDSASAALPSYNLVAIDTDTDALAVAMTNEAMSGAREMSVFTMPSTSVVETRVFGLPGVAQASLESRTLANVLVISGSGMDARIPLLGAQVIAAVDVAGNATDNWTFSTAEGVAGTNCRAATTNLGSGAPGNPTGNRGRLESSGAAQTFNLSANTAGECDTSNRVFCIAH